MKMIKKSERTEKRSGKKGKEGEKAGNSKLNVNLVLIIQKLKNTEKALKYELAKNRAMIENSPDCIKILDRKGSILHMNKGGLIEHNFKTSQEAVGWDWVSSLEKPYRVKALQALKECLKGKTSVIDVKHTSTGSNREWCSMTITPIRDGHGKVIQVLAISRDITDRKKKENQLKAMIKRMGSRNAI